jgi:hypothetical protein
MRRLLVATVSAVLLVAAPAMAAKKVSESSKAYAQASKEALKATHGGKVTAVYVHPKVPQFIRYDVRITKGGKKLEVDLAADFSVSHIGPAA